jgi:GNAT superfamily N-acetyltransferase
VGATVAHTPGDPGVGIEQYQRGAYVISTAPERLDAQAIHAYLSGSYWAECIPLEVVERALRGSLCFGLYAPEGQVGLARIITDHTTFAYVCDVYVLPHHRGQGLGRWLMECVLRSPRLQGLRQHVGFRPLAAPTRVMEIARPGMYRTEAPANPA